MSVRLSYAFEKGNTSVTYTYDAGGSRASKTVNGTKSEFVYLDGKLVYEKRGGDDIFYLYDSYGSLSNIRWYKNGASSPTNIYVITNRQGDVLGLYDYAGTRKVSYEYDAWGNTVSVTDISQDNWSTLNPFRYRGYYFDIETGLYYLLSRYYDPAVGRFLNADGYVSTGTGITGLNMFVYCGSNPVAFIDSTGTRRVGILEAYIEASAHGTTHPNSDLAKEPDLDINTASPGSYNCYGNAIGKVTTKSPSGYKTGDSTRETFNAVKKDLGGSNVRELESIDSPISKNEYKVALKCGKNDYHFIRLYGNKWYNKSGSLPGLYVNQSVVAGDIWYPMWAYNGRVYIVPPTEGCYDDETIYFAVREGWDSQ